MAKIPTIGTDRQTSFNMFFFALAVILAIIFLLFIFYQSGRASVRADMIENCERIPSWNEQLDYNVPRET